MNLKKIALFAASLSLAATAFAGGGTHTTFAIAIDDDSGHGMVELNLDSDQMGFNLHDMQEGESRSIVDESGRAVLITRKADGFKVDIDGKTIDLPMIGDAHGAVFVDGDYGEDFDMHVVHGTEFVTADSSDGVTIVSGNAIDDTTRESIRSVLMSAGHSGDVEFIDAADMKGGMHKVKVIKKEVEVTR